MSAEKSYHNFSWELAVKHLSFRDHWKQLAACLLVYIAVVFSCSVHGMEAGSVVLPLSAEGFIKRWGLYYLFAIGIRILGALPFCAPVLFLEYIGFRCMLPAVIVLFQRNAIWAMAI